VTFLGTGGALPSKHRNVSGILLSYKYDSSLLLFLKHIFAIDQFGFEPIDKLTPGRTSSGDGALASMRHILFDCGEGTMFQLVRLVGPAEASAIIAALDFVWLSHAHADHHLGFLEVAREFFRMTATPLKVFAPTKLHILHRRQGDAGLEEGDACPMPWLPLLSMWEGVPMQVSLCSDLAVRSSEEASGASAAASSIRQHAPSCELLGVTAARVDHRRETRSHCASS
jgi:ribonuclease BN (tRNA processing enzyme)